MWHPATEVASIQCQVVPADPNRFAVGSAELQPLGDVHVGGNPENLMRSAMLVILAVAIGVPVILFLVLEALARYGMWVQERASRRRFAFGILSAVYLVLAVGMFVGGSQHFSKWMYLAASVGMAFCAWWEGRGSSTEATKEPQSVDHA
jgi:uncharacterized protein YodC (DUF2158 family)